MKEIRSPNLALEKMRSLHKRKADFRPHRPSSGYHAPTPPQPTPSYSAPSSYGAPQPVIMRCEDVIDVFVTRQAVLGAL